MRTLLCVMMLMTGLSASAQQISVNEALDVARSCQISNKGRKVKSAVSTDLKLAYTAQRNGNVCYYVFNRGNDGGFVIVGGDERANKILAIVPEGSFNYDELPANVKAWLEEYEIQIDRAIRLTPEVTKQEKEQRQARRAARAAKTSIPEMITTKWGQRMPYNNNIITQNGRSTGTHGRPFVAGCVATAMAQVMKKWEYPTTGNASNSYYSYSLNDFFTADFGNTTYNWAGMLDDYSDGPLFYTPAQADAVATLTFHCGVACETTFSDDESGATLENAAMGMQRFFGYSNSVYPLSKHMVSEEDWVDIVYNELKAGRPILYAGGVHAFVCHGYDAANDLYAINWGWYGTANGYFAITGDDALTPDVVGDGGDAEGYGSNQQILCGVQPALSDPVAEENAAPLAIANNIGWQLHSGYSQLPSFTELDLSGGDQNLTLYAELRNLTGVGKDAEFCVMFEDEATGERIYTDVLDRYEFWPMEREHVMRFNFSTSIFENSSLYCPYLMVRPAGQPEAEWIRTLYASDQEFVKLSITGRGEQHTIPLDMELVEEYGQIQIKWDYNYQGEYTITSSNDDIISVSWGNYLNLGSTAGTAEITVVAEPYGYYGKTIKTFAYTNKDPYSVQNYLGYDFIVNDIVAPNAENYVYGYDYWSSVSSTMNADGGKLTFSIKNRTWNTEYDKDVYFVITNSSSEPVWVDGYPEYLEKNILESFHVEEWNGEESKTFTIDLTKHAPLYEGSLSIRPCFTYTGDPENGYVADDNIGGLYFNCTIAPTLEIPYTLTAAGWGTVCLPYATKVPAGLEVYVCSGESNGTLILDAVSTIEEKTPYITSGTPGNYTFRGPEIDEYNLQDTYNRGMLTGVLKSGVQIPENAYLLQKKSGVVGFYRYVGDAANATQYRAFLNGNKLSNGLRSACYFPGTSIDDTTNIEAALPGKNATPSGIYDVQGRRIEQLQKGINILRMEDGSVKKVLVNK